MAFKILSKVQIFKFLMVVSIEIRCDLFLNRKKKPSEYEGLLAKVFIRITLPLLQHML